PRCGGRRKCPLSSRVWGRPSESRTGTVSGDSHGRDTLTLRNNTTALSFSTTQKGHGSNYSAEAIAEAPPSRSGVLPLTNFGTADFSGTLVNGQPIGNLSPDRIDMVSGTVTKAQTSQLSA